MLTIPENQITMSSREIAELTDKRHDNVMRTIEKLYEAGVIGLPQFEEVPNPGPGPLLIKQYQIGKRDSFVVVAQLSPEFTARLVDRWQELESANQFKIPKTLHEALRLAADQAEVIALQDLQIKQQRPAVEFLDRYVEAKSDKGLREVAKILGIKQGEFIADLADRHIIFKQSGNWLPYAHYQHAGYFTVKTGESSGHAFVQAKFTPSGIAWIAKHYS